MTSSWQLPTCHIYYPTTFANVLSSFLHNNEGKECFLLGQLEPRPRQPAIRGRTRVDDGAKVVTASSKSTVRTRSKSRTTKLETESSALSTDQPPSTPEVPVFAINIVGISSSPRPEDHRLSGVDAKLRIVGKVRGYDCDIFVEDESNLMIYFGLKLEDGRRPPEVIVEVIGWNGRFYYPDPNHIILFDYDPFEFQLWKVPQGYPLGLPKVFLDGIGIIQKVASYGTKLEFISIFPKIHQDFQDLNACSEPPARVQSNVVVSFVCKRSSGIQQCLHKLSILVGSLLGKYPALAVLNFLVLLALDSLLGYVITSYLMELPSMLGLLHTTVDEMLVKLNHLLRWLRGAPAGLKLNVNLNALYWRFFSYHIHLWANYIGILEPVFAIILNTIQYYGVLGATIQISLMKDLLSLATFHVYCLYIYATRLYSLQATAIRALLRVFFGRKFNPLRKRIDNVQLSTPELFLSSFGFVILIFLFPTTLVYYAGFVVLRLPVLVVERALQYLVETFNNLPFVSWALVFLQSPRVADEIYYMPKPISQAGEILTFRVCLRSTRTLLKQPDFGKGVKNLVGAVMGGTVLKD